MRGYGPFLVWHQKPTMAQLVGTRIMLCIIALLQCALVVGMIFVFSELAGTILHWIITALAVGGAIYHLVNAARGGLEAHDYLEQSSAA